MLPEPPAPERHDLVWLAPGWRHALARSIEGAALAAIDAWISAGRPAVACRRPECPPVETAGVVALGIAFPAGAPVRRAALLVGREAVSRVARPLALAEALASAPARWRGRLGALEREARLVGLTLRVYGSLAWQHLSGTSYLTERSDVDLAVAPRGPGELRHALRLLAAHEAEGAPPLDGEILLPAGGGVAWRELAARPERVLVKSLDGVALARTRDALGPLAEGLS